jgi:hypothetical protein
MTKTILTTVAAAAIALAAITAPAKAADAPSCDQFRARLTKAKLVLEVDGPGIQTFRLPDNQWKLTLLWLDGQTDGGILSCDPDGEVEDLNLLLPWSTARENAGFEGDQRDSIRSLIASVIYAYAPWKKAAQIIDMAEDVLDKRLRPGVDATAITIEGDAKIKLLPMSIALVARGPL